MCQSSLWQVRACNGAAGVVGLKCWADCRDPVQPKQFRTDKEVIENEMLRPWLLDVDLSIFGNGSWDAAFTLGKAVLMVSKTADSELVNEVLMLRTSGKFGKAPEGSATSAGAYARAAGSWGAYMLVLTVHTVMTMEWFSLS